MKIYLIVTSLLAALCWVAEYEIARAGLGYLLAPPPSGRTFGGLR